MTVDTPPVLPEEDAGPSRGAWSTTRASVGLLRERSWQKALAGVIILTIIFFFLGRWQLHRHEAKEARNHLVKENYNATPVPLAQLIPAAGQTPAGELPKTLEWRQVTVTGRYDSGAQILLRNRPNSTQAAAAGTIGTGGNSQNGYEVVVPLRTTDGAVLFVDRGWIPAGSKDALHPDSVPAAPSGQVTVVARLRPSEDATHRAAPAGQAIRLNIPALTRQTGVGADGRVVGAFGALVSENPAATDTPIPTDPPDSADIGVNFSYFVQWEAFAVIAYGLFGVAMVREVRRRDEEDDWADGSAGPEDEPDEDEEPPAITRATYR